MGGKKSLGLPVCMRNLFPTPVCLVMSLTLRCEEMRFLHATAELALQVAVFHWGPGSEPGREETLS